MSCQNGNMNGQKPHSLVTLIRHGLQNETIFDFSRVGRCLQGNLWYSLPASMTSRLASVTLKTASKVFTEETDKNFDFITVILFRFLGFGDFKVSIVTEN